MSQNIYFATNRVMHAAAGAMPAFAEDAVARDAPFLCGVATVENIDTQDQNSGTVTALSTPAPGAFAEADLAALLASPNDVVVFIHGAMNGFTDSITRAAYNQAWLNETVVAGGARSYDMITFSWPAKADYGLDEPWTLLFTAPEGYYHDWSAAEASDQHISRFLALLYALRARIGNRKMHLLCHSMGCHALGGAVEAFFRAPPAAAGAPLFDTILLPAGDEESSTFTEPNGGRLSNLRRLGNKIVVYFNRNDGLMHLSRIANHLYHLGFYGPPGRPDLKTYPSEVYTFVNCIGLKDTIDTKKNPAGFDATHQYYRQTPTVRRDIAMTLAGQNPPRPFFYPHENFHAFKKIDFSGVE